MTYKVNGTDITLQPTTGKWIDRREIGVTGDGHNVYPAPREFEMRWGLMSASEFNQLTGFFSAIGTTGSAVVTLPQYGASSYTFYDYTGCVLQEPTAQEFFEQYVSDVKMLVVKVIT